MPKAFVKRSLDKLLTLSKELNMNILLTHENPQPIDQATKDQAQLRAAINNISNIEIGTTNVCNRKCQSCPVGTGDIADQLTNSAITDHNFDKILNNLSPFKNKRVSLSLHEYNEPLKDKEILNKYQQVRVEFPNAYLKLFTNGDLIHKDKKNFYSINQLLNAGIDHIRISIYDAAPEKSRVFERIGISADSFSVLHNSQKNRTEFTHYISHNGRLAQIRVLFLSTQKLSNRGGIIASSESTARMGVCSLPGRSLSIDYLGNLKMCCNVHHMESGAAIYGSLINTSITSILMSESHTKMRNKTLKGDYSGLEKCKVCDFYQKSTERHSTTPAAIH